MKKGISLLVGIILISCFDQKHKPGIPLEKALHDPLNIYDIVYLDILKTEGPLTMNIINFDSLSNYHPKKERIDTLLEKGKITLKELEYSKINDKNKHESTIVISDSVRTILKNRSSNLIKAEHSFSKPIYLAPDRILLFQYIVLPVGSSSEYGLFFSMDELNNWQISEKHHFGTYRIIID